MRTSKTAVVLILCTIGLLQAGLVQAAPDEASREIVPGINAFNWDLFAQLAAAEPDGNLFFSPYSVSAAMAMTREGARGETGGQLDAALHFPPGDALQAGHRALTGALRTTDHVQMNVANGLMLTGDFGQMVRPAYRQVLKQVYDAEIFDGDLDAVNEWVRDRTQGRIHPLLDQLDPNTVCVILNAIYFKGDWATPFDEQQTQAAPFHVTPQQTVEARLMHRRGSLRYLETDQLKAVELPYEGGNFSMTVWLPAAADGLAALEAWLNSETASDWIAQLDAAPEREVQLYLPRFKLETSYQLVAPMQALGVRLAFQADVSDFSRLGGEPGDIWIAQIAHKGFVEVNEEGTEAAAATAVVMVTRAMPTPPPVFRADRPFLFMIRHRPTGTILFTGRLANPAE